MSPLPSVGRYLWHLHASLSSGSHRHRISSGRRRRGSPPAPVSHQGSDLVTLRQKFLDKQREAWLAAPSWYALRAFATNAWQPRKVRCDLREAARSNLQQSDILVRRCAAAYARFARLCGDRRHRPFIAQREYAIRFARFAGTICPVRETYSVASLCSFCRAIRLCRSCPRRRRGHRLPRVI